MSMTSYVPVSGYVYVGDSSKLMSVSMPSTPKSHRSSCAPMEFSKNSMVSPMQYWSVDCGCAAEIMVGSHMTTFSWKSRMTVLNSSPSRYSDTQIPMTYAPGAVGKPVIAPVAASISKGGAEGIGSIAPNPGDQGISLKVEAGRGCGAGLSALAPFSGVQSA